MKRWSDDIDKYTIYSRLGEISQIFIQYKVLLIHMFRLLFDSISCKIGIKVVESGMKWFEVVVIGCSWVNTIIR